MENQNTEKLNHEEPEELNSGDKKGESNILSGRLVP